MRYLFRVRYKECNGRDGGMSETKSFKTIATDPKKVKCHKKGARIVSVRMIKPLA
jgi:hypothetical protein